VCAAKGAANDARMGIQVGEMVMQGVQRGRVVATERNGQRNEQVAERSSDARRCHNFSSCAMSTIDASDTLVPFIVVCQTTSHRSNSRGGMSYA
jgi:hypothetical protein